jgi:hypothetical protein
MLIYKTVKIVSPRQSSIHYSHALHRGVDRLVAEFGLVFVLVAPKTIDGLLEDQLRAFPSRSQSRHKTVTGTEGLSITNIHTRDKKVDAFVMESREAFTERKEVAVSSVFQVMEVIGIIDYPLKITLVIPHLHGKAEKEIVFMHIMSTGKCFKFVKPIGGSDLARGG